ncbi:ABC transporter substrate-binding protein [Candidatus Uabimicrobium sp. HlEnr_7]|uniref:ABC transporter substrate-binding protein n=1 Tax=Candidatus Uabimicrobium helgolandensis TaxID=3095367 RepID=UPI003556D496
MKFVGIISILLLLSCTEQTNHPSTSQSEGYPLEITDAHERTVTVSRPPQKIVVAGTALYAQIVNDLKAGHKIVGIAHSKNTPKSLQKVASVGKALQPNLEKIISLQPDIVFGANSIRGKLQQMNIPVFIVGEPPHGVINSIKSLNKAISNIDLILHGNTNRAKNLIAKTQSIIKSHAQKKTTTKISVAVVYFTTQSPPYVIGNSSLESEIIEKVGGQNVFNISGTINIEELIKKNPQVIFTDPSQISIAKQLLGAQNLQAVENNKLYGIKASSWVSTNLAQTFITVSTALYGNQK